MPSTLFNRAADEGAVAIVALAAALRTLCARRPATLQVVRRIAPGQQAIQSGGVGRNVHHAAERAALIIDAHQFADAGLPGLAGVVEFLDVVRQQDFVLAIEQGREACKSAHFFGEQPFEMLAANVGIQALLLRSAQVPVHAQHLVGDALRLDLVSAFLDRGANRCDARFIDDRRALHCLFERCELTGLIRDVDRTTRAALSAGLAAASRERGADFSAPACTGRF